MDKVGLLNPVKCAVAFEPKPSDPITIPYSSRLFLLDYLSNIGLLLTVIKTGINTF